MRTASIILFSLLLNNLAGQITGDGTSANPYIGRMVSDLTWPGPYPNNTLYIGSSSASFTVATGFFLNIAPGIVVSVNGNLIVEPGGSMTAGSIQNNGTLALKSDDTGIASLIFGNYSGSGNTNTELYLTGGYNTIGGENYLKWHYISTPTAAPIPVTLFTVNTLNLAQYVETLVTTDPASGWVGFDGYLYATAGQNDNLTFSSLSPGKGYNHYFTANETYTISGTLNSNNTTVSLKYSGQYPGTQGYNLIGNPFSSCFDWDYFYYTSPLPSGVNDAIYFTVNDMTASYVNGVGQGGGGPIIPPMQGFFVQATQDNIQFTLPAAARVHDRFQARYKSASASESNFRNIPIVRIEFGNDIATDDAVLRFDSEARSLFDKSFDAHKFTKTAGFLSVWTRIEGIDYSINGLPFPKDVVEIPVGIFVSSSGEYTLSSKEIKNLDGYSFTLTDLSTNVTADLSKGEQLNFLAAAGVIDNRFILKATSVPTSVNEEANTSSEEFKIYQSQDLIIIIPQEIENGNEYGGIYIYDYSGKMIFEEALLKWENNEIRQIPFKPGAAGLYLIELKYGSKRYVKKISLSR